MKSGIARGRWGVCVVTDSLGNVWSPGAGAKRGRAVICLPSFAVFGAGPWEVRCVLPCVVLAPV